MRFAILTFVFSVIALPVLACEVYPCDWTRSDYLGVFETPEDALRNEPPEFRQAWVFNYCHETGSRGDGGAVIHDKFCDAHLKEVRNHPAAAIETCHHFCTRPHGHLNRACIDPLTGRLETELGWNKANGTATDNSNCDTRAGLILEPHQ
jgi:hypothetical protein